MVAGQFDKSVGLIIQARMSSTRFPGKVLMPMPFGSTKSILHVICDSLQKTGGKVIVVTSANPENNAIEKQCHTLGVECFRGSEDNVFSRFLAIQRRYKFQSLFRFTADNPFIDVKKLNVFYSEFCARDIDYAYSKGMPLGMNFEVMKGEVVFRLGNIELTAEEKEHVTARIRKEDVFKWENIKIADTPELRMTVDTGVDYAQASMIMQSIQGELELWKVQQLRKEMPWLFQLNQGVLQNCSVEDEDAQTRIVSDFANRMGYHKAASKLLKPTFD